MGARDDQKPTPNRIRVFDGQHGLYLDTMPGASPDGSWRRLVNAEFTETNNRTTGRGQGGMRKRGGIAASSANLGAPVVSVAGVPLPSEMDFSAVLMLAMNTAAGGTSGWKKSTDGTTFTDIAASTLPRAYQNRAWAGVNFDEERPSRCAIFRRSLYYPSNNYTEANPPNDPPPVALYAGDGRGYDVFDVPQNPLLAQTSYAVMDMIALNSAIYFVAFDQSGSARCFKFDPIAGILSVVGNPFAPASGSAMSLAWYQGRLWVGTYAIPGTAKGYIYSLNPFNREMDWTLERTSANNAGGYHQLIQYGDDLFACTDADAVGTAVIERRTAAGVWSTSFTAAAAGTSRFSGAIVFDDKLFVGWYKWSATTQSLIKVYNGSSWSTDKDIKADYALKAPGQPTVFDGALYWPVFDAADSISATNFLMKRTTGGVYSRPLTGVALQGTSSIWYPTPS